MEFLYDLDVKKIQVKFKFHLVLTQDLLSENFFSDLGLGDEKKKK